jgi:hypothetical protein
MNFVVLRINDDCNELGPAISVRTYEKARALLRELAEDVLDSGEMKTFDACFGPMDLQVNCFGYTFHIGGLETEGRER